MLDTKEQIRTALIEIAEALGRPHYEPLTVREVLASFDNNTDHPLKMAVLRKIPFLGRKSSINVVASNIRPKKPARKASPVEVKKEILKLAQHGTITKFRSGCDCKECMEWA
ncbi:hypothetical protein [Acinetobacter baumannii]|uniref:hypothetical protein n=1 Tax=Acinetobacter baumannii TaxID=470 RepID=UPI000988BDF6|nr:hypothetical protein [Acinetobacter baumannii]OOD20925.1 hypothetical protein BWP00_11160 [Acinetobacter baumannii]